MRERFPHIEPIRQGLPRMNLGRMVAAMTLGWFRRKADDFRHFFYRVFDRIGISARPLLGRLKAE